MIKHILIFTFTLLFSLNLAGQSNPEDIARDELERRGLADEEVRERLEQKGIDINNIDINNPSEIFKLESSIKQVIDEMEKDKLVNRPKSSAADTLRKEDNRKDVELTAEEGKILAKEGESISNAIDDGASLEEAVSEELIDAQENDLPPAKVYGQEVFRSQSIKLYRQSEDVKPPETYILGVNDVIAVSIWGASEEDLIFEINKDGYIKPEGIPRIYLKGLKFSKAKSLLQNRFSKYYNFKSNQFEVALNFSRTINVNITGEVYNYGTFNIPAINSVFNAMVAAGGPSDIGSVRKIKHIRPGIKENIIDIYKYLKDPTYAADLYLEENDILHVPIAEKIIKIDGAIIRPHSYELLQDEDLVDLLKYCGGLKANASLKNIQITRFENDLEKIIDVNLNTIITSDKDFDLKNGDRIFVQTIPEDFKNTITIDGAVTIPGEFAINSNTKLSDVLKRIDFKEDALKEIAYIKRKTSDRKNHSYIPVNLNEVLSNTQSTQNVVLQNEDQINIYALGEFVEVENFKISGAVRSPKTIPYDYTNSLRIKDAIFLSGGLKKFATDFAYLKRRSFEDPYKFNYEKIDIATALLDESSTQNILIFPGDEIVVYSKEDFTLNKKVKVSGYVNSPGTFEFGSNLSIKDAIAMSDGLKEAHADFAYIKRIDPEKPKETEYIRIPLSQENESFFLKAEDEIVFYALDDFVDEKTFSISGSVRKPGTYNYGPNTTLSDVIEMSGGLTFSAYRKKIDIYRLKYDDDQKTSTLSATLILDKFNKPINGEFILEPFDQIIVRQAPEFEMIRTVFIKGEVKFPGTYALISDNEKLSSIIERAGGLTAEAFKDGIYVQRSEDNIGFIALQGSDALGNFGSGQNIILKGNDEIVIPKSNDLVTINGFHNASILFSEQISQNRITVPFSKKRNAKYYVEKYAGGKRKIGDYSNLTVQYPNGTVESTKRVLFVFHKYPKVKPGCTINIPEKIIETSNNGQGTDWNQILTNAVGQATAVLTLILLIQSVD